MKVKQTVRAEARLPQRSIQAAKRRLARQLVPSGRAIGVGIERLDGEGERLKVYLAEVSNAAQPPIPSECDGYPVVVEIVGRVTARLTASAD